MKGEKERNAVSQFEEKVVESLIESSRLEYPPIMVDMELQGLIEEYKQQLMSTCRDQKEFDEKMKQMPEAKLRENGRPLAKKRVLWTLVINEVARVEEITVTEQEIDAEIEEMIKDAGPRKDEYRQYMQEENNRLNVESMVRARKTIKRLVEIAQANNSSDS
jgi:trigger factor